METTLTELHSQNGKLFQLLLGHRKSDLMQRITAFVVGKTTKNLTAYLADTDVATEEKLTLTNELIEIVTASDWAKLPASPLGQAAPTTAPTPKIIAPVAPPVVVPPLAKATFVVNPGTNGKHAPKVEVEIVEEDEDEDEDDIIEADEAPAPAPAEEDPMAIIAAQLKKLQRPVMKSLSEAEVRRIVRSEMGQALADFAALWNSKK